MSDERDLSFAPLTDGNYASWVIRMEAELIDKDLWEYVSGEIVTTKPEDGENAKARRDRAEILQKQRQACARIIKRVTDDQLGLITSSDPITIWADLKRAHQVQGFGSRLALKRRFWNAKKKDGEKVSGWVSRVKRMRNELKVAGSEPADEDVILVLTDGMPASYGHLIIAIDGTPTDQLLLDNVITRLRNEEGHQEKENEINEEHNGGEAMVAKPLRRDPSSIQCFECKEFGHYRSNCPEVEIRRRDGKLLATAATAVFSW